MTDVSEEILTRLEDLATAIEDDTYIIRQVRETIEDQSEAVFDRVAEVTGQIAGLQAMFSQADHILDDQLEAAVGVPLDAAETAVETLRTVLEEAIERGGAGSLDQASDEVAELRRRVDEFGETVTQRIEGASNVVTAVTGAIEETLTAGRDQLENALTQVTDDVSTVIEEEIMTPITDQAERLSDELTKEVEETAVALVEKLFEESHAKIKEPIEQALELIADVVEAEIETLKAELTGGDDEGKAQREALNASLDLVKEAFDPMKDALDQFMSLAEMVGIKI